MTILLAGLLLFFGIHLFPSLRDQRQQLIDRVGINTYKGVFSLLSVAAIALIAWGYSPTDSTHLWQAPAWGRSLAPFFMLPAVYAFVASGAPSNLKRLTLNPLDWSVLLWAVIHLLNNGDLASLLLFGSFGLFALFNMWSSNRRPMVETVAVPLGKEAVLIGISVLAYIALVMFHPALFGVPVF